MWGYLKNECFSKFSEQETIHISKTYWFLGDVNTQRLLKLNLLVTSNKDRMSLKLFQNVQLKKGSFESLPISSRKYDNLQSLINDKILPHSHSSFNNGLKFEQE